MSETSTATPPLQCLSCWYTIGVDGANACPECGEPVTEVTRRLFYRRAALAVEARHGATRSALTILAGVALYVALIAIGTSSGWPILTGFLATFALALLGWAAGFAITPWLGASIRSADPGPERRLVRLLWNRHVVLLHVPWLLSPVLGFVLLVVGTLCRFVSNNSEAGESVAGFILFLGWVGACIVAITEWVDRWGQDLDAACLRCTRVPAIAGFVSVVLLMVYLIAGFAGTLLMLAVALNNLSER